MIMTQRTSSASTTPPPPPTTTTTTTTHLLGLDDNSLKLGGFHPSHRVKDVGNSLVGRIQCTQRWRYVILDNKSKDEATWWEQRIRWEVKIYLTSNFSWQYERLCAIRLASDLCKNSMRSISFLSKRNLSTLTKKKQNNQKQNSPEEVHADLALVHNVHLLQQIFSNLLKNSNHHLRPMVSLKFGCKFLRFFISRNLDGTSGVPTSRARRACLIPGKRSNSISNFRFNITSW